MKVLKRIKNGTEIKIEKIKMKKRNSKKSMKDKWREKGLKMRDKKGKD